MKELLDNLLDEENPFIFWFFVLLMCALFLYGGFWVGNFILHYLQIISTGSYEDKILHTLYLIAFLLIFKK